METSIKPEALKLGLDEAVGVVLPERPRASVPGLGLVVLQRLLGDLLGQQQGVLFHLGSVRSVSQFFSFF